MKKTFNVDKIRLKPISQAERIAIADLTAGLMVLQSDGVAGIYIYNGTVWVYSGGASQANKISTFNTQNQSYTLSLADLGKIVEVDAIAATNVTIPLDATVAFPIGTTINLAQFNIGQVTILAASGVTILSSGSRYKLTEQYSLCSLIKKGTNQWYLSGDLSL